VKFRGLRKKLQEGRINREKGIEKNGVQEGEEDNEMFVSVL